MLLAGLSTGFSTRSGFFCVSLCVSAARTTWARRGISLGFSLAVVPLFTSTVTLVAVVGTQPAGPYSSLSDTTYVPAGSPVKEKYPFESVRRVKLSVSPDTSVPFIQTTQFASPCSPSSLMPFRFQS